MVSLFLFDSEQKILVERDKVKMGEKRKFLVCQNCKYCLATEEEDLPQCPKCGSNKIIRLSKFRSTSGQGLKIKSSTLTLIIIFLIGAILTIAGVFSLPSSLPVGITLIIIGLILLAIGSKGAVCASC
ncbi:MAG: hypothetical protein ACFFBY_10495 [Promethearchaeota archaeon]